MTKVRIDPGICGFTTIVKAQKSDDDEQEIHLEVASGCKAVQELMKTIGDTVDAYELCLVKPGKGPLFDFASQHFPIHVGCPVLSGITKCVEAESGLALKKDAVIHFEEV
jgi:hypothetical protein